MRRSQAYKEEIGKTAIIFLVEGDTISGTLSAATESDVILEVQDLEGVSTGIRHTVPWGSVYRVMTMNTEALLESIAASEEEDDRPEPPDWVAEVLAEEDHGTV